MYNNKATAPFVAYISPGGSEGAVEQHSGQGPLVADKHDKATGTIHRWYFAWGLSVRWNTSSPSVAVNSPSPL